MNIDTKPAYFSKEFGKIKIKTTLQMQLLSALQNLFSELKPQHVDPTQTFITNEGREILIVVMPFKNFEYPSLFLKLSYENSDTWINIGWADLPAPPWCCHDDLDAGYYEKVIFAETDDLLVASTLQEITEQLSRPIYIEKTYANKRWLKSVYKVKAETGEDIELGRKKANVFYRLLNRLAEKYKIVETLSLMG
jgi:hypothetical protein